MEHDTGEQIVTAHKSCIYSCYQRAQKGQAWQYKQQETSYRQCCRNSACINTKSAGIVTGDVLVRHSHLVCWCKCKNEALPRKCAAASPPGTGPAHSVGLPQSRLEVSRLDISRLPRAASLDLTCLSNPTSSCGLFPKLHLRFTLLGDISMTLWQLCQCSFSVMSTAPGESDLTPTEVGS